MAGLLSTTTNNEHSHFVYVNNQDIGLLSLSGENPHIHEYNIEIQEQQDPQSGEIQQIPIPVLMEAQGHTHELADLFYEQKDIKDPSDNELMDNVQQLFSYLDDLEHKNRELGEESKEFKMNKQWKQVDIDRLKTDDRTCLTINEVKPVVDILSGEQRLSRTDIHFTPVEGGDGIVAEMLNIVTSNILDTNDFPYKESQVFEDGLDVGRGTFNVEIDRTSNIEGDIVIRHEEWDDVWFAPHEDLNGGDCEYLIRAKWIAYDKGVQMYGEKFKDVPLSLGIESNISHFLIPKGDIYKNPLNKLGKDTQYFDKKSGKIRIFEWQYKDYRKNPVVYNALDEFYLNLGDIKAEDLKQIMTIPGMNRTDVVKEDVRIVNYAGKVLLDKAISELKSGMKAYLSCVPLYGTKYKDNWQGKIEPLKDMNREVNYRHSQAVDIIRHSVSYTEFYDDQTFPDQKEAEAYRKNKTKAGYLQRVQDTTRVPVPSQPYKPTGDSTIVQMEMLASAKINKIANINAELMGQGGGSQSGVAITQNKKAALTGNEFLFDNLSYSKKQLGRLILAGIQTYTPERIYRILDNRHRKKDAVKMSFGQDEEGNPIPFEAYPQEEVIELLRNSDLSKYDVAITESMHSPTKKMYNFLLFKEMAQQGVPIPISLILELSDLPATDRDAAIQQIQQQQQAEQELENKKIDNEMNKTVVANIDKLGGDTQNTPQ